MATLRGFLNNYSNNLNGLISDSDTAIAVNSDTAIQTLLATNVDYVALTLDDGTNVEVVHCTAADGSGNITVSRGEDGTSGTAFADNVKIEARVTEQGLTQINEWQPIDVNTLTGTAATIDFTVAAGTYKIVFDGVILSAAADLHMQQGTGVGPTIQATGYEYSGIEEFSGASAYTANRATAATQIVVFTGATNTSTHKISGEILIDNVDVANHHTIRFEMSQISKSTRGSGYRTTAEIVTAVRVKPSTGNFAAGSKFILYKRNN